MQVSNVSWVLQSSEDEIQNNGYPEFWGGKQGTIWSRWKWWMLEAYGIFFTAPTIFLFSLLVGEGGDIIHKHHRDIWRARTQARSGLAFTIHTLSLNKYIPQKMWINFWPLQAVCVAGVWGVPACPFPTSATQAGHYSTKHPFSIEPFLAQMFDTIRKVKMSKIYTLYKLFLVEKFKSMVRTSWY